MTSSLEVFEDIFVEADSRVFRLSGPVSSSERKLSSAILLQVSPTRSNALFAAVCTRP